MISQAFAFNRQTDELLGLMSQVSTGNFHPDVELSRQAGHRIPIGPTVFGFEMDSVDVDLADGVKDLNLEREVVAFVQAFLDMGRVNCLEGADGLIAAAGGLRSLDGLLMIGMRSEVEAFGQRIEIGLEAVAACIQKTLW